jgi:prepilin-type N-terminal cleavage/methylation domain-containing protein/prepilin-type processing-associated H-X9-DG protein
MSMTVESKAGRCTIITDFCTIRPKRVSVCSCSPPFAKCQGGFTLIELLVVIAIIAILAALLLAGLAYARMAGETAVCRSNLHQIGLGMRMYVNDFSAYPGCPNGQGSWFEECGPFVGAAWPAFNQAPNGELTPATGAFACPGFNDMPGLYAGPTALNGAYGYNYNGTGNGSLSGECLGIGGVQDSPNPWIYPRPTRENEILKPSDMIAVGDAVLDYLILWVASGGFSGDYNLPAGMFDPTLRPTSLPIVGLAARVAQIQRRHAGRFCVLFCDGHVEYLRPEELYHMDKADVARRWNKDNQAHQNLLPMWPSP